MKSYIQFFNIKKFDVGGEIQIPEKEALLPEEETLLNEFRAKREQRRTERKQNQEQFKLNLKNIGTDIGKQMSGVNFSKDAAWKGITDKNGNQLISDKAAMGIGLGANIGVQALNAVDNAVMGDKNFGAQSAAIDTAVHGVSGALMKSGNPYAMLAGAALEVGNFATKATGQTVKGFDVDINSSGYGNLGHMESSSSRDFGALIGLGGLNQRAVNKKLARRNEQAQMALKASNITDEIKFEQEARMNSVDDTIRSNEIALSGGLDTSLLAAKKGGRISRFEEYKKFLQKPKQEIPKAQNGAKLEKIELSEESNVIPEGTYHKNKHNLDIEGITEKGIPVITVSDDSAETFTEIKEQENSIQQHAEVENNELTMNLELTKFIEEKRNEYHNSDDKDDDICLEVGMRFVKELLYNTDDNTKLIDKIEKHEQNDN